MCKSQFIRRDGCNTFSRNLGRSTEYFFMRGDAFKNLPNVISGNHSPNFKPPFDITFSSLEDYDNMLKYSLFTLCTL